MDATVKDAALPQGAAVLHLVAELAGLWLAIPTDEVVELFVPDRLLPIPAAPSGIAGLCHLRGRAATAIDLRQICPGLDAAPARVPIAVGMENGPAFFALLVDDVDGMVPLDSEAVLREGVSPLGDFAAGHYRLGERQLVLLDTRRVMAAAGGLCAADDALERSA